MFKVQPLRSKELQCELAAMLGVRYFESSYAFFAVETDEEGTTVLSVLGMCQFDYTPEGATIRSIAAAPGREQDEAIFIMVRTVMNFCYRAELPCITLAPSEDSADMASNTGFVSSLGFRAATDHTIDLKKFYRSPCHYEKED